MEGDFEKKMEETFAAIQKKVEEESQRNRKFFEASLKTSEATMEATKRIAIALEGINISLVRILKTKET